MRGGQTQCSPLFVPVYRHRPSAHLPIRACFHPPSQSLAANSSQLASNLTAWGCFDIIFLFFFPQLSPLLGRRGTTRLPRVIGLRFVSLSIQRLLSLPPRLPPHRLHPMRSAKPSGIGPRIPFSPMCEQVRIGKAGLSTTWEAQASPSTGHQIQKDLFSDKGGKSSTNNLPRPWADNLQIQMKTCP